MAIHRYTLLKAACLVVVLLLQATPIAQAATPACGTTLTSNTKLDSDMDCPNTALSIGKNNITLDCKGHSVSTVDGTAIIASGVKGATVKNCNISTSAYFSHGILLTSGTTKTTVKDNTISTSAVSSRGIEVREASANTISGNTIHTTNTGANGIRLRSGSDNNLVRNNHIETDASYPINIESSSGNKFDDNQLIAPSGFLIQRGMSLQNGGLGIDTAGNIYAVENDWGSSDGIGTATAFFQVDPTTGEAGSIKPLLVGGADVGFGFDALDVLPNGRIFALSGCCAASSLYEIDPGTGEVTTTTLNLPVLSGKPNGLEATSDTSLLATTNKGELLSIDLNTSIVTRLGSQGTGWTDLAIHPTNAKAYAVSRRSDEASNTGHLYEINPTTGQIVIEIGDTGEVGLSSIDFALDETLYGNSDGELVVIDTSDASTTRPGGSFGPDPLEPFPQDNRLKNNQFENVDGSVTFAGAITLPTEAQTNLSATRIAITPNQVMVDTAELPFLDESARIVLNNLTEDYRNLLVDPEDDGSFVPCESPQCEFVSYLDGTLIFDVSGFTTYSSEENDDPSLEFIVTVVLAEINAKLSDSNVPKSAKKKLKAAKKDLVKALKFIRKDDLKKAFTEIGKAVTDLVKAAKKDESVDRLIEHLVEGTKAEAQAAIDAAIGVAGDSVLIAAAEADMIEAQNLLDQDKPDKAIKRFQSAWVNARKSEPTIYTVGDKGPAGGIVFYVTDGGIHGLEAAPKDVGFAPWCKSKIPIIGAEGVSIGTGAQNTADILAGCPKSGNAAALANAYKKNGYKDWYLPSRYELNIFVSNILSPAGNMAVYWSSSEGNQGLPNDQGFACSLALHVGTSGTCLSKAWVLGVRAVRTF